METRIKRLTAPNGAVFESASLFHEGKEYTARGAYFNPESTVAVAYLSRDGRSVTDFSGNLLGTATVTSRWRVPNGVISGEMLQVDATIGGIEFTGRCSGEGMLWRGKRKAK